jgi:hypothetical protein
MRSLLLLLFFVFPFTLNDLRAQQYTLKQSNSVMGMKTESTIYVKGMRKRTESGGMMGQTVLPVIEQCDLQRTITINDKKKLYFIEPFSKQPEEVIDVDVKQPAKSIPVSKNSETKGGTITMFYSIIDTGERKTMYGFKARHIWTNQKLKPSADACSLKDSIIIKTDGWYIDLPQFNCPMRYAATRPVSPNAPHKLDCQDRFITRRKGNGRLGFPLIQKTTMLLGDGSGKSMEMETNLETIELLTGKLDSMLFEIPPGYTEAKSLEELQEKPDYKSMIKDYSKQVKDENRNANLSITSDEKSKLIIGVYVPAGDESIKSQGNNLQDYIVSNLNSSKYKAIPVSSEEDAKAKKCELVVSTDFQRIKQASKIGGLIKAVKNADPNAASSYNIELGMSIIKLADGSVRNTEKVSGKYEGKPGEVVKQPLQEGCGKILADLER